MAKQPYISHVVNGYSRYDLPESVAFTCTPGILYPVRVDFINARDRVTIDQGIDVRSNPLAVPSFNPYTVRLHRFWAPLQLYHPEMRTNSSSFDMNDLSLNWIPYALVNGASALGVTHNAAFSNSLLSWLYAAGRDLHTSVSASSEFLAVALGGSVSSQDLWVNADPYLAYWDIVRNYYSFSQWKVYSYAWPGNFSLSSYRSTSGAGYYYGSDPQYFTQVYGNLEFLDAYFESQFYPNAVPSDNNTYNRIALFGQIMLSDLNMSGVAKSDGYPVFQTSSFASINVPSSQLGTTTTSSPSVGNNVSLFALAHPMGVVPSSPDRFSRLLPPGTSNSSVSMSGISTIPQLAVAARLQEYKDLLGAGGSRYSDWLETFFASKIEHVDRPKLLFSASQMVNVQVVLNQAGNNNNTDLPAALGQQGGAIAFNSKLGRSQSYYFREPGYMIDMFSIRPVYYWSGIQPDWAAYQGADYFNPVYNDIGYQDVAFAQVSTDMPFNQGTAFAQEPCYNEFRSSFDRVKGQFTYGQRVGSASNSSDNLPLYSYWVQQRNVALYGSGNAPYKLLYVDMFTVNSPFASTVEDNFFVNLSYSVRKKNLVNKTFATRLANR